MKPHAHPAARARGVTLVELLIAVTISLLLVVVIAQLFLGSRQTFATTDDVSRMQDNIRYAQQLLIRTIHLAGYKSQANSITANVFSGANSALGAVDGGGTSSDTITVRYQGSGAKLTYSPDCRPTNSCNGADGYAVDCLGVRIDAGMMAENTFSIANGANGRPSLFCNNGTVAAPGVEIVPNVINMQIVYGEDTNGDLVADSYITPPANPNNVVSVRIGLLFETPTVTAKTIADATESYDVWGDGSLMLASTGGTPAFPSDRRIRRLVVTTINLRNRTP